MSLTSQFSFSHRVPTSENGFQRKNKKIKGEKEDPSSGFCAACDIN